MEQLEEKSSNRFGFLDSGITTRKSQQKAPRTTKIGCFLFEENPPPSPPVVQRDSLVLFECRYVILLVLCISCFTHTHTHTHTHLFACLNGSHTVYSPMSARCFLGVVLKTKGLPVKQSVRGPGLSLSNQLHQGTEAAGWISRSLRRAQRCLFSRNGELRCG